MADKSLPLWGHVVELRSRLMRVLWCWLGASVVSFAFRDFLFEVFAGPAGRLVFLTPTGALTMYLKLSALAGFIMAMPVAVWQMWAFAAPALKEHETTLFLKYGTFSLALFFSGAALGWQLVRPSFTYLMSFQNDRLVPMITVEAYSSFVAMLVLGCGLVAQMPAVLLWLSRLGWVSSYWLISQWRGAVVACVAGAGILTPTVDVATQILVATPMIILYALSVACVKLGEKLRERAMLASSR